MAAFRRLDEDVGELVLLGTLDAGVLEAGAVVGKG